MTATPTATQSGDVRPNHYRVREEHVTEEARAQARPWRLPGPVGWRATCSCGWEDGMMRSHPLAAHIEAERHQCVGGGTAIYDRSDPR